MNEKGTAPIPPLSYNGSVQYPHIVPTIAAGVARCLKNLVPGRKQNVAHPFQTRYIRGRAASRQRQKA